MIFLLQTTSEIKSMLNYVGCDGFYSILLIVYDSELHYCFVYHTVNCDEVLVGKSFCCSAKPMLNDVKRMAAVVLAPPLISRSFLG